MSILCPAARLVKPDSAESTGPFVPSVAEDYHETGYAIGLLGESPPVRAVFGHHSASTRLEGTAAYYRGLDAGLKIYARQVGYELGLGGQFCDRPEEIHRLYDREFASGWQAGADLWADRVAIMAGWDRDEADPPSTWHEAEIARACGNQGGR